MFANKQPPPSLTDRPTTMARPPGPSPAANLLLLLRILLLVYLFLLGIGLLGDGLKALGKDFSERILTATSNPFVGLFIGVLATSVIQSSSTTTSLVVLMVGDGVLSLEGAIPIIMGANIGTTVTNILVSLIHLRRREEFQRALGAAMVHDFFNLMAVAVFLPLELLTGFLRNGAQWLAGIFEQCGGTHIASPVKLITEPITKPLTRFVVGLGETVGPVLLIVLAVGLLIGALVFLVRALRAATLKRLEVFFDSFVGRRGLVGIMLGLVITAIIQSSSVTTSLLVPMAAAGILTVEQVFPITLGANIGTTVTALLTAMAKGRPEGVAIAFVHLLFNLAGTILIYPFPALRGVPIRLARGMAGLTVRSRWYPIIFVLLLFFLIPTALMIITGVF